MNKQFAPLIKRAKALRLTEAALYRQAGISPSVYSRAKNGVSKDRSTFNVLNTLDAKLTELEAKA